MDLLKRIIKIKFIYESYKVVEIESSINDKIEDSINKFSAKINIEKSNLYFLYNGLLLKKEEYKERLIKIMNKDDQNRNTLVLLAYKTIGQENVPKSEDITILLIKVTKEVVTLKGKRKETFKDIFERSKEIIGCDLNKLNYSYRNNKPFDINKKFDDIAVEEDQNLNGLAIYTSYKNIIYVKFINKKFGDRTYESYDEEKLEDLFKNYCSSTKLKKEDLIFKLGDKILDKEKIINDIWSGDISNQNSQSLDQISNNTQTTTIFDNYNKKIKINVIEKTCCQKNKKKIIILLSIIGL